MADETISIADLSPDEAKAAIVERQADPKFMAIYGRVAGPEEERPAHKAAVAEMQALYQAAHPSQNHELPTEDEAMVSLRAQYGGGAEEKIALAQQTVLALGGGELQTQLDETGVGNDPAVIRKFIELGQANQRMPIVRALRDAMQAFPDAASAKDEIVRLQADPDFLRVYGDVTGQEPGHKLATARMTALYQIAHGETVLDLPPDTAA